MNDKYLLECERRQLMKTSMIANMRLNKQNLSFEEKAFAQKTCEAVVSDLLRNPEQARLVIYDISPVAVFHRQIARILEM